ncbi:preprotein translocase subunit SecG [Ruminococcus sp. YE71]|uniref:preprotein translocase subunit SecG n=1 Tax=unclassified Ruminococcus TaxID=2608920 RepID=UPI000890A8C8|nr:MULTISPECIES: preprotein translocase subunit SecG [unclassified Ruminococcus]SDA23223.1 preprotein translocase subunit SecG [Ruminococcus sp. YE78]SFW39438.1 preprotein translocase subunit SecG [Ruminococcus sp. YE71]
MSVIEIVAGAVLILCSIVIILVVLAQENKDDGLTSAIGGGYNESFYEGNMSRTKDAKLSRITKVSAALIFIITLALNVIVHIKK